MLLWTFNSKKNDVKLVSLEQYSFLTTLSALDLHIIQCRDTFHHCLLSIVGFFAGGRYYFLQINHIPVCKIKTSFSNTLTTLPAIQSWLYTPRNSILFLILKGALLWLEWKAIMLKMCDLSQSCKIVLSWRVFPNFHVSKFTTLFSSSNTLTGFIAR